MDKRDQFRIAMGQITDELNAMGLDLPEILKRRDRREPGRLEKERVEDRIMMLMRRYFKRQKDKLIPYLNMRFPDRKDIITPDPFDNIIDGASDDEFVADLIRLIATAGVGGVNLFQQQVAVGLDYNLINDQALQFARDYTYDLITGIDATTRDLISNAISRFIETPGMTIGDITRELESIFSLNRAQLIAVTETTNAYAMGQQIAGEALLAQFPDVRVVKKWYTNNDDRVCPICGQLDGEEVDITDNFSHGGANPPAHPNCRCWTNVRTRI